MRGRGRGKELIYSADEKKYLGFDFEIKFARNCYYSKTCNYKFSTVHGKKI